MKNKAFQITIIKPVFFLAVACLALAACAQPPDCFQADVFCAALVTDTLGLDDKGINQDSWAGLEAAKNNGLTDQIAYIESVDARDYDKNIAYFADRGFDVIITSGVGLQDETLRAADLYPASVFVGINQPHEESRPNLMAMTFPEDQMGFMAGTLAARLTKTGVVAGVCETSGISSMWRYCEGFRAGVKYIDENIRVLIMYRDSGDREKLFVDEAWGYDNAGSLIFRGADVVFAAGGVTSQGALRAASDAGVYAIGTERDQAAVLGESGKGVVTSLYGHASFEVQEAIRLLRSGHVRDTVTGQVWFVPLQAPAPEILVIETEKLQIMLSNEEIRTNVPPEKP